MRKHIAIPFLGEKGTAGTVPRLSGDEGSWQNAGQHQGWGRDQHQAKGVRAPRPCLTSHPGFRRLGAYFPAELPDALS